VKYSLLNTLDIHVLNSVFAGGFLKEFTLQVPYSGRIFEWAAEFEPMEKLATEEIIGCGKILKSSCFALAVSRRKNFSC
jgi:hypothetical protein